ncbi:hypothetical protein ACFQFQ_17410 [Sulfitobacter porphyrae]|uniref:Uncharacterized protein n=1 Tax=Sulfitobacter porphyrae TaxID=1246864 RepID=A0ABW2B5N8_9RHOB
MVQLLLISGRDQGEEAAQLRHLKPVQRDRGELGAEPRQGLRKPGDIGARRKGEGWFDGGVEAVFTRCRGEAARSSPAIFGWSAAQPDAMSHPSHAAPLSAKAPWGVK